MLKSQTKSNNETKSNTGGDGAMGSEPLLGDFLMLFDSEAAICTRRQE